MVGEPAWRTPMSTERLISGTPTPGGSTNAAKPDGTNTPGENGVPDDGREYGTSRSREPYDPHGPFPRGERPTHYDRLNERVADNPPRYNTGVQDIKEALDELDAE